MFTSDMHILIATDGSARSRAAADFLRQLLPPQGVQRITVLAVVDDAALVEPMPMYAPGYMVEPTDWQLLLDVEEHDAEDAAASTADHVRDRAMQVQTLVRDSTPAHEIIEVADEIDADLIVVGTHDHGALRAALLGSVSEQVLHRSHRAVLIVPHGHDSTQHEADHREMNGSN